MAALSKPPLILLVGPTAVGKSSVAIDLAERIGGEIVSADSRLFYRGMDVGTAKPTRAEQARVPHHLIDIADPDETLSLAVFQRLARQAIVGAQARGRVPLLVGGTGQYVRAVAESWQPPAVQPNARLRLALEQLQQERGPAWLHQKLGTQDPDAARKIEPANVRRTIRALEVILTTGRRFSEQRGHGISSFHVVALGLWRPRAELYARLDERIEGMFRAGLVDEVAGLLARGYSADLPAMSAIGYSQCVRLLKGELDIEQAKAEIRRATRALVRRQSNWFKLTDPNIQWFHASDHDALTSVESSVRRTLSG